MSVFSKVLRVGEGKKLRALQSLVPDVGAFADEYAALPDDAKHLSGHDIEAGAVDGAHQTLVEGERDPQIADREQWDFGVGDHRGPQWLRPQWL